MYTKKHSTEPINEKGHLNIPESHLPRYDDPVDFRSSSNWRIFRIMAEFIEGFQFIADFQRTVTIFGSSRFPEEDKWYKETRRLAELCAKEGFGIVTGGGPGIMEAANRGATDGKGESIGLNIQLPYEQRINPFVKRAIGFHYFFVRKVMLSYSARAYVYFPGGFGTLDEFFEIVTLIQTNKIPRTPIILVGKEYWDPLNDWIKKNLLDTFKTIDEKDLDIYSIVDTAEEAIKIIMYAPPRKELFQ